MPGDPFYRSAAWFRLRHACLQRDHGTCTTTGCGKPATHADHVIARAKGGADTLGNLTSQCPSCHSRKTARRDGGFGHAQSRQRPVGSDGWPIDVEAPPAAPATAQRASSPIQARPRGARKLGT